MSQAIDVSEAVAPVKKSKSKLAIQCSRVADPDDSVLCGAGNDCLPTNIDHR